MSARHPLRRSVWQGWFLSSGSRVVNDDVSRSRRSCASFRAGEGAVHESQPLEVVPLTQEELLVRARSCRLRAGVAPTSQVRTLSKALCSLKLGTQSMTYANRYNDRQSITSSEAKTRQTRPRPRKPTPLYETRLGEAYVADSLEMLRSLPARSVNLVITSPPYAPCSAKRNTATTTSATMLSGCCHSRGKLSAC